MSERPKIIDHLRNLPSLVIFPFDFLLVLISNRHQCTRYTRRAIRRMYVNSNGKFRHRIWNLHRRLSPVKTIASSEVSSLQGLQSEGIHIEKNFLPKEKISDLIEYFTPLEGRIYGHSEVTGKKAKITDDIPITKLGYDADDVIRAPHVLDIAMSDYFLSTCEQYFQCKPVLAHVDAWWSLPGDQDFKSKSANAQVFHFDYAWPVFLKFFIYLEDVEKGHGPFTFVKGSHEHKPVYRDGRIDDEEIYDWFGAEAVTPVYGKAGDLIIADTSGFHKGESPETGRRFILQYEFAISRLGAGKKFPFFDRNLIANKKNDRIDLSIFCR